MSKVSKKQMKDDRVKVLAELQKNSNERLDNIAKHCGFSRQKVWRIVKTIDADQLTWGYHAVADMEKINRKSYVLLVQWKHMPVENDFEDALVKRTIDTAGEKLQVDVEDDLWVGGGTIDQLVVFTAPDVAQAKQFQELFLATYAGNIASVTMLDVVLPIKRSGFLNPGIKQKKKLL